MNKKKNDRKHGSNNRCITHIKNAYTLHKHLNTFKQNLISKFEDQNAKPLKYFSLFTACPFFIWTKIGGKNRINHIIHCGYNNHNKCALECLTKICDWQGLRFMRRTWTYPFLWLSSSSFFFVWFCCWRYLSFPLYFSFVMHSFTLLYIK